MKKTTKAPAKTSKKPVAKAMMGGMMGRAAKGMATAAQASGGRAKGAMGGAMMAAFGKGRGK
jgi:hypothetical protein